MDSELSRFTFFLLGQGVQPNPPTTHCSVVVVEKITETRKKKDWVSVSLEVYVHSLIIVVAIIFFVEF
jgi:hypothetical protein